MRHLVGRWLVGSEFTLHHVTLEEGAMAAPLSGLQAAVIYHGEAMEHVRSHCDGVVIRPVVVNRGWTVSCRLSGFSFRRCQCEERTTSNQT